jgi:hypothetical protein
MLDKILYLVGNSDMPHQLLQSFASLLISRYNDRFLQLLRQFFFIPKIINRFMGFTTEWPTSRLNLGMIRKHTHIKKTPLEINFIYLGKKKIY